MSTLSRLPDLAAVRRRAGTVLFERVAGPDGAENRHRIHATPGPRWFEAGSPIQVVHGDASMFVGGLRALLLQSLHPGAMSAVADHSGYRGDPWGRLARTSTFLAVTTFGTADDAQAAVDTVRRIHGRIAGRTPAGDRYRADDPDLLRWVHVAEVDSFLRAHQAFGVRPLDEAGADAYVLQAGRVARSLGATRVPGSVAELADALEEFRPALGATDAAREAARFLLHEPPIPVPLRPGYGLLVRAALGSLPVWALADLDVARPGRVGRAAGLAAGHVGTRAIRWLLAAQGDVPRPATPLPHAA
ncbi:oxygenase MpaB family protein [Cellulomonas endophytica]|uniref:oxygenase MpaB family protein n=1 Tax=Cellulomonas endophytica TaxID=2494735 RepID=UPI001F0C705B|nr:oxygenase MpaB family protein [Cellulomonas endophytica]